MPHAAILAPDKPIRGTVDECLIGRQDRGVEVDYGIVVDGDFHENPINAAEKLLVLLACRTIPTL
jgi:hypothetical protein